MSNQHNPFCGSRRRLVARWLPAVALLLISSVAAEPFADIHIHYNWDQKEIIDAAQIVSRLREAKVSFAVASGTPSELALELARAAPDLILPFFSPYTHELGRRDWYLNTATLERAEAGLRDGLYHGIGEVHFMTGFRPRNDNPVFVGLMRLARQYAVPALIHVDAGNESRFVDICQAHPEVDILFAHAGGRLEPRHIRRVLENCANATIELSARDPWRYGGLTGEDGLLRQAWRALILEYPARFVTGTDPVWRVTRTQSWDQADDGWDYFPRLIAYHRRWLAGLPPGVRRLVSIDNASRLLRAGQQPR